MSVKSEDVPGLKWDKCVADTFMKMGRALLSILICSNLTFTLEPRPMLLY